MTIEEMIKWIEACAECQLQDQNDEDGQAMFLTVAAALRAGQEMRAEMSYNTEDLGKTLTHGMKAWDEANKSKMLLLHSGLEDLKAGRFAPDPTFDDDATKGEG